jgi:hypothetical protein
MSAIHADTVNDYKRAVASRFAAVLPGDAAQAACLEQVQQHARAVPK